VTRLLMSVADSFIGRSCHGVRDVVNSGDIADCATRRSPGDWTNCHGHREYAGICRL